MDQNAYAYIKSGVKVLGIIKSFKEDRLSFHYPADELIEDKSLLIDICIPASNISLKDVPVEVISDELVTNQPSFSHLMMRRAEVRYKDQQQSGLLALSNNKYTGGKSS
jgi:hypothetical protein